VKRLPSGRARRVRYSVYSAVCAVAVLAGIEAAARLAVAHGLYDPQSRFSVRSRIGSWAELFADPSLLTTRYGTQDVRHLIRVRPSAGRVDVRRNDALIRSQSIPLADPGATRVLFLGGSSIYGQKASEGPASIPALFEAAWRGRGMAVRAVNGGVNAGTSHMCREVLRALGNPIRPEIVVIYSGHNDYFPLAVANLPEVAATRPAPWVAAAYRHSLALWSAASLWAGRRGHVAAGAMTGSSTRDDARFGERFRIPDAGTVSTWRRVAALIETNYEANLRALVRDARSMGARVLLCSVTSNLFHPEGVSIHRPGFPPGEADPFDREVAAVEALVAGNRHAEALARAAPLLAKDDTCFRLRFAVGTALARAGRTAEALVHLRAARDLQPVFRSDATRAPTRAAAIVRRVAAEEGAAYLDVEDALVARPEYWSRPGAWFSDHLHFTPEGMEVMADLMGGRLRELGWLAGTRRRGGRAVTP
jgi:lysophospholipase L1-like esterase